MSVIDHNDMVKMEVIAPDGTVIATEVRPYWMTVPQFKRNMVIKYGQVKQTKKVKEA